MISNAHKKRDGGGFHEIKDYITRKTSKPDLLVKNCLFTDDPSGEMYAVASSNTTTKPTLHVSLSLEPGEKGTFEQWQKAIYEYVKGMGFDIKQTQFMAVMHSNTNNEHVHLLINRVQLDGKLVSDSNERKRSHDAARKAEVAGGFLRFNPKPSTSTKKGKTNKIKSAIDDAILKANGDARKFKAMLAQQKINVVENRAKDGRLNGISFQKIGEKTFKGSDLGKDYGAGSLQKRGLNLGYVFNLPATLDNPKSEPTNMKTKLKFKQ